jgi:hypothetical protein
LQVPFREAANELVVQKTLLSGLDCLLVELTSNNRLIELNEWVCYDVTIGRDLTTAVHVVSISNDENREVDSYYSRKFLISCPSVSTRAHNYVIAVIKTMTTSKKLTSYSDWDLGWEIKRSEKRGHRVESN